MSFDFVSAPHTRLTSTQTVWNGQPEPGSNPRPSDLKLRAASSPTPIVKLKIQIYMFLFFHTNFVSGHGMPWLSEPHVTILSFVAVFDQYQFVTKSKHKLTLIFTSFTDFEKYQFAT